MANKLSWLEEVKADAKFNYMRRLREQEEKKAFEESKSGLTEVAEVKPTEEKKGK